MTRGPWGSCPSGWKRTLEIIGDPSTEVNAVLRARATELPGRLKVFFDKDSAGEQAGSDIPAYLTNVVTSQLDADRSDYLLRDSYATGTDYGQFDLEWLIQHLNVDRAKGRFYLDHKAQYAAEAYVFARYHMYRTVYFHKTTRAAEVMLRLMLRRYKFGTGNRTEGMNPLAANSAAGARTIVVALLLR